MKHHGSLPRSLALLALVGAGACVDGRDPMGPDLSASMALAVAPSFAVAPTQAEVAVLSRARIVAVDRASSDTLGRVEQEIDPDAPEWFFDLVLTLPSGKTYQVDVSVELLSDIVEWSGRSQPFALAVGAAPVELKSIAMLRGPLDNLAVTDVQLSGVPGSLPEGVRGQASSTLSGGGEGAVVFYRSLTPTVLEVTRDGVYQAVAPGQGLIEARAGARADTAAIAIQAVPVEDEAVQSVSGGLDDSVTRLAPSLQDAAGAQAIVESLGDFEAAMGTKRASNIVNAIDAARKALASYGNETIRYQDGPELSLIELVLDYTERVVLSGLSAFSRSK